MIIRGGSLTARDAAQRFAEAYGGRAVAEIETVSVDLGLSRFRFAKGIRWYSIGPLSDGTGWQVVVAGEADQAICDYCQEAPATGRVAAYDAIVCEECYADHHGPALF